MISVDDLKLVTQAIELLYHGVNIEEVTDFKQYYNPVTKKFQSKVSPNIKGLLIHYSDECLKIFNHYYGSYMVRIGPNTYNAKYESGLTDDDKALTTVEVSVDMLKKVMMTLFNMKATMFSGINMSLYDPDFQERLSKIRREWDYKEVKHCPMMDTLTCDNVRQNLEVLLTMGEYPLDLCKKVLDQLDSDEDDFEIDSLKGYKIIDHRLYIPISPADVYDMEELLNGEEMLKDIRDTKYIVISRNPYDYFFCSYGSAIQSCYSINSPHFGGHGMYTMSSMKGHYLVYGTHGNGIKCNVINGKKWNVPHMYWRCWAWLSEDNVLMLDRVYSGNNCGDQFKKTFGLLIEKFIGHSYNWFNDYLTVDLKYGKDYAKWYKDYKLRTYPDSVRLDVNPVKYFGVCHGNRDYMGSKRSSTDIISACRNITEVSPTFHLTDKPYVKNGVLCVMKTCPITQLPIDDAQEKSFYSKFYKEPLEDLTVVTFCDGCFKLTETSKTSKGCQDLNGFYIYAEQNSNNFSELRPQDIILARSFSFGITSLPVFKEKIKQLLNKSTINNILLKVVDDNSVQYIKYRK